MKKNSESSNDNFLKIFNSDLALMAISRIDNGVFIDVNSLFLRKLEYSKEEVIGKRSIDLGFFEKQEERVKAINTIKEKGFVYYEEVILKTKNGSTFFGTYSANSIRIKGEEYLLSIINDITDRKNLEIGLNEQKRFLKSLINAIPDLIFYKDMNGRFLGCNHTFAEKVLGMKEEDIIGKTDLDIVGSEEMAETIRKRDMEILANNATTVSEDDIILADGTKIKIEGAITPFSDEVGKPAGLIAIGRDITQRKKDEISLRESEMRLSLTTDSSAIGLWDWDIKTGGLVVNDQWTNNLGYTQDELAPINVKTFYDNTHPEDIKKTSALLKKCFSGEIETFEMEMRMKHKNGKWIWALGRGKVVEWDGDNNPIRMLGTQIDISNSVLIREEIEDAKKAAENLNQLKDQFLANVSHEIRTPINGIIGFLDLLTRSDMTSEQKLLVNNAKLSSDILLNLINDILDFSKIGAQKLRMVTVRFNIRKAVEDTIAIIEPKANEKKLKIHTSFKENIPEMVQGDPTRLQQILNNLLGNAVKFTDYGGIYFSMELVEEKGNLVCIYFEVMDTGIGLSRNEINTLFMPFSQIDSSPTRKHGGTGLGLAISKELVKMLNGVIGVNSIKGKGSTFHFTAWFDKSASNNEENDAMTSEKNEKQNKLSLLGRYFSGKPEIVLKPNILIVEDNDINGRLVIKILEQAHLAGDIFKNGIDAINAYERKDYDIIFMDCQMPIMNGYECTAMIRRIEGSEKHIPIIAMTANASESEREKCLFFGMDDYISKPIKPDVIFEMVYEYVLTSYHHSEDYLFKRNIETFIKELHFTEEEARPLYDDYMKDLSKIIIQAEKAIEGGRFESLGKQAHWIKGSSANLRLYRVQKIASQLEKDASAKNSESAKSQIGQLKKIIWKWYF